MLSGEKTKEVIDSDVNWPKQINKSNNWSSEVDRRIDWSRRLNRKREGKMNHSAFYTTALEGVRSTLFPLKRLAIRDAMEENKKKELTTETIQVYQEAHAAIQEELVSLELLGEETDWLLDLDLEDNSTPVANEAPPPIRIAKKEDSISKPETLAEPPTDTRESDTPTSKLEGRARSPVRAPTDTKRANTPIRRSEAKPRTSLISYVSRHTERQCIAAQNMRKGQCRICGVRVQGRSLEKHCRQHFIRIFCRCGWQSVSRDSTVQHQKKMGYSPEHGIHCYEADREKFPQLVADLQWSPAPSFQECKPHLQNNEEDGNAIATDRYAPSRMKDPASLHRRMGRTQRRQYSPAEVERPVPVRVQAVGVEDNSIPTVHQEAEVLDVATLRRRVEQTELELYQIKRQLRRAEQAEEDREFESRHRYHRKH